MELLMKSGGPLESSYAKHVQIDVWSDKIRQYNAGVIRTWLRRARLVKWQYPDWNALYPVEEYPLVYANTVVTLDEALKFRAPGRSIILHIHEMAETVEHFKMREKLKASASLVDCFIAASHAVESYLLKEFHIPADKIRVVHEFAISDPKAGICREDARKHYELSEANFAIGMCGTISWRKGVDLFIRLAQILKTKDSSNKIRLLWLGGNREDHRQSLHEISRFGLTDKCQFIEETDNPATFYAALDAFALTSREDPFSIAMLEAGLASLPIVCFQDSGGAPEFAGQDAGFCVPYANVAKMADAFLGLIGDEGKRSLMGSCARRKVIKNYTLDTQAPKILAVLNEFI